ncbi:MAG: MarR family transcriptional regulator [Thermoleophilaceae bacterium]|nr:MarR family transcriptional regulator [Thermoleophilaceae bacterium]
MDFEQANEVVRALRRLAMAQRGRKVDLLRKHGLQPGQDVVLLELAELGQASQKELAEAVEVDEPSVGRSIARLETKNLLKRSVDPGDSRRRVVELTTQGRKLIPQLKRIYIQIANETVGDADGDFHKKLLTTVRETTDRFE